MGGPGQRRIKRAVSTGNIATVSPPSVLLGLTLGSGMLSNETRIVLLVVVLVSALVLLFVGFHHWL